MQRPRWAKSEAPRIGPTTLVGALAPVGAYDRAGAGAGVHRRFAGVDRSATVSLSPVSGVVFVVSVTAPVGPVSLSRRAQRQRVPAAPGDVRRTPRVPSLASAPRAPGSSASFAGTIPSTSTAPSSSSLPTTATHAATSPSWPNAGVSMPPPAPDIPNAGAVPLATGNPSSPSASTQSALPALLSQRRAAIDSSIATTTLRLTGSSPDATAMDQFLPATSALGLRGRNLSQRFGRLNLARQEAFPASSSQLRASAGGTSADSTSAAQV